MEDQGTCFVIQPFDGDVFDRRFVETYQPAIKDAGLVPYRVDKDPGASIPIDAIEIGIRNARVCFADVSLDNPNVWFELGYAIASGKELCLICEQGRPKFPFDVQHRQIITYKAKSSSDFEKLKADITLRIATLLERVASRAQLAESPIKESGVLTSIEGVILCTVVENLFGAQWVAASGAIAHDIDQLGYNRLALNLGLSGLQKKGMIEASPKYEDNEEWIEYRVLNGGWDWVQQNQQWLNLKKKSASGQSRLKESTANLDDEIPF